MTAGTVVAGNLTAKNATLGGGHTVKVENGTNVDMGGNQIHNVEMVLKILMPQL
ncbi:hypothetical protein [Neisseria subflava]|uniref:hypothetical protein n=1 Tax=Neisseria subflava TaxID=28449 RepID=UPI00202A1331|nr:hypothetical protein [Neisseria subflava]MCL9764994.1 hypothetical protein [Neisseria subflava]